MASHLNSLLLFLLSLSITCLISVAESINNGGGVTIDLIHRDSPLSPSHDPSKTPFQRLRNAFHRSFSRQYSLSSSNSLDQTPQAPLTASGGEYLIEYQIGTPPVRQLSILDTTSGSLSWIQCKPCTKCYKQDYPLFDTASSKSYRAVGCETNQCAYSGSIGCANNLCLYELAYGDRSFSNGEIATDTLTIGTNTSVPNFVFGCGRSNGGNFKPTGSGVFALGKGINSLVIQQATLFHSRFSYCLTIPGANVSSKISFGNNAVVSGPNVVSTPVFTKETDTFYYLSLQGISVGTHRFEYKQQSGEQGNIVIDSGTTQTFIPAELYKGIEAALVKEIKATRVKDPKGTFNLCYQLPSNGKLVSPSITAHFKGADVVLPQGTTFLQVEKGLVCLTLLPTQKLPIFGSLHQVDYLIGYDLLNGQFNFLKTDCTKPL